VGGWELWARGRESRRTNHARCQLVGHGRYRCGYFTVLAPYVFKDTRVFVPETHIHCEDRFCADERGLAPRLQTASEGLRPRDGTE